VVTSQRARLLSPGAKLGKYDLIRQIAVGGMAELYLSRTVGIEGFEKLVVVKRILPQYSDNASFVNMFLNEARLAATLHHPNIAQVFDIGQEAGDYFFAMEYVHGEDLGHLVATAHDSGVPMSLDAALTLVAGLCAGLHYAHEKANAEGKPLGVVHRDVSPSNVLVSYDGTVKLVDFGIARVGNTPSSTQGGLKGKIGYMSPEQCRGKVELDRRSDVFSVGTILYELTTGQVPFTDETEYGVLNQIVTRDAAAPSTIVPGFPPALEAIVLRALARDRDQRYASALELQGAIEDFAHENRLRVSPLVLARLMGTLFPQRLEEWDHARAQGAFFVEQHVVRTLIESGKTGDIATQPVGVVAHVATLIGAPPPVAVMSDDETTNVTQPLPPPPGDAEPTGVHEPVALASDLISHDEERSLPSMPVAVAHAVDVAPIHNSVVDRGDTVLVTIRKRRRWPLALGLALVGSCAAALVTYLVLDRSDAGVAAAEPTKPVEHTKPWSPEPPPALGRAASAANQPASPVAEQQRAETKAAAVDTPLGVAKPSKLETKPAKAVPKPEPKKIAVRPKSRTVKLEPKAKPPKPEPPEAKPEPKEPTWQPDSPFMPVRPDKR
jgi:serine/threonine protein kinase